MEPCSVLLADVKARIEEAPNVSWAVFVHEWISEHVVRL